MSTFPLKKAAFAAAAAATLLVTGCSAPSESSPASTSAPTSASAAASATPSPTSDSGMPASALAAPGATMDPVPGSAGAADADWPLNVGSSTVKAGSELRVYGAGLTPGSVVKVYGAQQMAMPSYDAKNDMYHQVGEEVILTATISATVDANGKYDTKLLIPAGTAPQLLNIVLVDAVGGGNLVQVTVQ